MRIHIPTITGTIIILAVLGLSVYILHLSLEPFPELPQTIEVIFVLPEKEQDPLTLMFVGDIMLDRGVKNMVYKKGDKDYKFPFLKIRPYLKEADLLFGNLESVISDKGSKVGGIYSFRAEPQALEGLSFAGFDIVSVANNHVFDYGREAMEDSFLRLKEAGISYTGGGFTEKEAHLPVIKEAGGIKIAFLAYTDLAAPYWMAQEERSGIARLEKERMQEDVKKAAREADLVVVSFHYGYEYHTEPNAFQISVSRAAIEAGAHLVIGHHPHVIQPVEEYQEGYIAYSLGNFIFDQAFSEETMEGLILKVVLRDRKIAEVVPVKFKMNQYFQPEISLPDEKETEDFKASEPPSPTVKIISEDLGTVDCLYRISGVPSPKGVAFTPDGQEFWVTSLMNKFRGVVVFDSETGDHKKNIILPDGGGVEIIFNKEGSLAFVSQMETGRVFEIDAKTKEILRTFDTNSSWTKVLALSPKEDFLYASNWSGNDVSVIDLKEGQSVRRIPTVTTPRGIYATEDGSFLYVAGFANGQIQKINLQTGQSSILYESRGAMRHIAADQKFLYFSDMAKGVILKADKETDYVTEFAKTDKNPNTIVLTPDKTILLVSNRGANHPSGRYDIPGLEFGSILFFDTSNGQRIASLTGGNQPTALDVSADGKYFIYSNFLDGSLAMCLVPSLP